MLLGDLRLVGGYKAAGQRRVAGEMYPAGDGTWYDFRLQELDDNDVSLGDTGIVIEGTWNVESMEQTARITGLELDDRMLAMCPQMAQLWWDRMQPRGRVSVAQIMWRQGEPPSVELQVERMSLTIPLGAREFSASFHRPASGWRLARSFSGPSEDPSSTSVC